MATVDAAEGTCPKLNSILSELQDVNKAKRKKALQQFSQLVFEGDRQLDNDNLSKILGFTLTPVLNAMNDKSEVNRTLACSIISKCIDHSAVTEKCLTDIVLVIHHRLATVPVVEESEEVRLEIINILHSLTLTFQAKMIPFMNDVVNILKEAVIDGSPDVRKAASECVCSYAIATKEKFHTQSESLVKPLLKALHQQRFRNRIACILALGEEITTGIDLYISLSCYSINNL